MAAEATPWKRLFLRNLKWSAEETGASLYDTLKCAAKANFQSSAKGKVLVAASGNGRSHTYELPRDYSPDDAAHAVSDLLDRYDEAVDKLGGNPSDDAVFRELMHTLQPVDGWRSDYTGLRTPREEVGA
jgi:hypothetical protein